MQFLPQYGAGGREMRRMFFVVVVVLVGFAATGCATGGNLGRYSSYPMYRGGMGGPQLSQADKLSVFCGLGASAVAMLLDASVKKIIGAGLLSAAACEAVAM